MCMAKAYVAANAWRSRLLLLHTMLNSALTLYQCDLVHAVSCSFMMENCRHGMSCACCSPLGQYGLEWWWCCWSQCPPVRLHVSFVVVHIHSFLARCLLLL
jgi:hypothetical protein